MSSFLFISGSELKISDKHPLNPLNIIIAQYSTHDTYISPDDFIDKNSNLINYGLGKLVYNEEKKKNWETLKIFMTPLTKEDRINEFVKIYLRKIVKDLSIIDLQQSMSFFKTDDLIYQIFQEIIVEKTPSLHKQEDAKIARINKEIELLHQTTYSHSNILTSVDLSAELAGNVLKDLGQKYTVIDQDESIQNLKNGYTYKFFVEFINLLKKNGLAENRSSWSKNDIEKFINGTKLSKKIENNFATEFPIFAEKYLTNSNVSNEIKEKLQKCIEDKKELKKYIAKIPSDTELNVYRKSGEDLIRRENEELAKQNEIISKKDLLEKKIESYVKKEIKEITKYMKSSRSHTEAQKQYEIEKIKTEAPIKVLELDEIKKLRTEIENLENVSVRKSEFKFKKWQLAMIKKIKEGKSCLVNGPTGGGKTFISMIYFDTFIRNNSDKSKKMVYVAPNYHLALQIYASFRKTFENVGCSFITSETCFISESQDTQIFIGTPDKLSIYFHGSGVKFQGSIFDEIHTISLSFGEDIYSHKTSESISNLLGMCETQIVALSATIQREDIHRLQEEISIRTGIRKISKILYKKRAVPVERYIYGGDDLQKMNSEDFANEQIEEDEFSDNEDQVLQEIPISETKNKETTDIVSEFIPVTPENTFNLFKILEKNDKLPVILFDQTEENSYNNFKEYIRWIDTQENQYVPSNEILLVEISRLISSYNNLIAGPLSEYNSALASKNEQRQKTTYENLQRVATSKYGFLEKIILCIQTELAKSLSYDSSSAYPQKYKILDTDGNLYSYNTILCKKAYTYYENIKNKIQPFPHESSFSDIPMYFQNKSEFFRIGPQITDVDFEYLKSKVTENNTIKKCKDLALKLCQAESINFGDLEDLINLIVKGLNFGVGIILPTFPFIIQYFLLKSLNKTGNAVKGSIKVVFASKSMNMGVNFGLRTVIIRNQELHDLNVCVFRQEEGRAGRQGLDTQANVISWNIANTYHTTLNNLPRIVFPPHGDNYGCFVQHYVHISEEIVARRIENASNIEALFRGEELDVSDANFDENSDDENESVKNKVKGKGKKIQNIREKNAKLIQKSRFDSGHQDQIEKILSVCIIPLSTEIGLEKDDIYNISRRIISIVRGELPSYMRENTYFWIQKINLIKLSLQEIYIRFRNCVNYKFLEYIENVYMLLHKFQYIQLKL